MTTELGKSTVLPGEGHLFTILKDDRWKIKFDHHMINDFGVCEAMFQLKHVPQLEGPFAGKILKAKGGFNWYATFGIWWAHVLEDFYTQLELAQKNKVVVNDSPAVSYPTKGDLISYAVKWWRKDEMDRFQMMAPDFYAKFAGGWIQMDYEGKPYSFPHGAVLLASQYFDHYEMYQDATRWKIIGTEVTFGTAGDLILGETDKVVLAYQGRPDLVVYSEEYQKVCPVDTKTGGAMDRKWREQWKPQAQMPGYAVSVQKLCDELGIKQKVDVVIINGASRDIPSTPREKGKSPLPRFQRVKLDYTESELAHWKRQMLIRAERLRYCIENDAWMWRESACHNQYNHPCEFREIHNHPPEQQRFMIQSNYVYDTPWSPDRVK